MSLENPTPEENAACLALIGQMLHMPAPGDDESPAARERRERLRDEFAMAALTGLTSRMSEIATYLVESKKAVKAADFFATMAYEMADAMLRGRTKG